MRISDWSSNVGSSDLGFDEACQFLEAVVRFLLGWNRAAEEVLGVASGQRVRAVLASNPPLSAQGQWVIGMFRPWLDVTHPRRAKHGELRWFIVDPAGKAMEVDGPGDIRELDGKRAEERGVGKECVDTVSARG